MIVLKQLAKTHKETIVDKTASGKVSRQRIFSNELIKRLLSFEVVYHVMFYAMVLMFVHSSKYIFRNKFMHVRILKSKKIYQIISFFCDFRCLKLRNKKLIFYLGQSANYIYCWILLSLTIITWFPFYGILFILSAIIGTTRIGTIFSIKVATDGWVISDRQFYTFEKRDHLK